MRPDRFAVIPTRDRPEDLRDCVDAIIDQVDLIFVVDNGSYPPVRADVLGRSVRVVTCPDNPPNLSALWNQGIDLAAAYANSAPHFVAVLNDDAIVPGGWLDAVVEAMEETGAAMGSSPVVGTLPARIVHRQPGPVNLFYRLAGFAFVLRGESNLRADESMAWWYGGDDLEWRAREAGGAIVIPDHPVEHRHENKQMNARPELSAQAGRDRATFEAKWSMTPW